jgi:uncharacterized lipoprotein NlpE involved in copper resistance
MEGRAMKLFATVALIATLTGCGPDKELLMETKFDAPLRKKVADLMSQEKVETIAITGKCMATIDGLMRQELVGAGADVHTMTGEIFTADVSSDDVFSVAALEFVTQLQLSQKSAPTKKK